MTTAIDDDRELARFVRGEIDPRTFPHAEPGFDESVGAGAVV